MVRSLAGAGSMVIPRLASRPRVILTAWLMVLWWTPKMAGAAAVSVQVLLAGGVKWGLQGGGQGGQVLAGHPGQRGAVQGGGDLGGAAGRGGRPGPGGGTLKRRARGVVPGAAEAVAG